MLSKSQSWKRVHWATIYNYCQQHFPRIFHMSFVTGFNFTRLDENCSPLFGKYSKALSFLTYFFLISVSIPIETTWKIPCGMPCVSTQQSWAGSAQWITFPVITHLSEKMWLCLLSLDLSLHAHRQCPKWLHLLSLGQPDCINRKKSCYKHYCGKNKTTTQQKQTNKAPKLQKVNVSSGEAVTVMKTGHSEWMWGNQHGDITPHITLQ